MAPEDDFPTKPQRAWSSIGYQIDGDKGETRTLSAVRARNAKLERLELAALTVGLRAQEILCRIAERLARGAKQYGGDFDDKPRDWNAEALEEMLDCSVYLTMAAMKQEEAKAADKARAQAANRGPKAEYHIQAGDVGESRAEFPPLQDAGRLDPRDGGA
jgi:hypothetical protein